MKINQTKMSLYEILDHENIPIYIGITNNIRRRMMEHKREWLNCKNEYYLYRKLRKQPKEYEFKYNVLKDNMSLDDALQSEQATISEYKKLYKLCNLTNGGEGGWGHIPIFTEEWKNNLSDAAKERVKKYGIPFYGKKHSDSTKDKISKAKKGKQTGSDNPFYGRTHSDESKILIGTTVSLKLKNKPKTDEHRANIGNANRGKSRSKGRINAMVYDINVIDPYGKSFIWKDGWNQLKIFILSEYKIDIGLYSLKNSHKPMSKCDWSCSRL